MNRIAIEVGTQPLVLQLSGVVELTITAKPPEPWKFEIKGNVDSRTQMQIAAAVFDDMRRAGFKLR